jgi:hypothetical protein
MMCRFLDAGNDCGASLSGGRRPKSAKARSRGRFGSGRAAIRYGDLMFAPVMEADATGRKAGWIGVRKGALKCAVGLQVVAWRA